MNAPNEWPCPGCSALVVYKGYGRRGKYCTRACLLSYKSKLAKAETAARKAAKLALRPHKQGNLLCRQCKEPLPPYGKVYCSPACNHRSKYQPKHVDRVSPEWEAKKTARNLEEAPPCSICRKSTARKGWYKVTPHPKIPPGVELCASHRRSFSGFICQNDYGDLDIDTLWTAYLIRLTYANQGRQPWVAMMREAFASRHKIANAI